MMLLLGPQSQESLWQHQSADAVTHSQLNKHLVSHVSTAESKCKKFQKKFAICILPRNGFIAFFSNLKKEHLFAYVSVYTRDNWVYSLR